MKKSKYPEVSDRERGEETRRHDGTTLTRHSYTSLPLSLSSRCQTSLCGTYTYDLLVIGGGSGGLAASKKAAGLVPGRASHSTQSKEQGDSEGRRQAHVLCCDEYNCDGQ